jgi:hypothetical protein
VGPQIPDDEAEKVGRDSLPLHTLLHSSEWIPTQRSAHRQHISLRSMSISRLRYVRVRKMGIGLMEKARAVPASNPPLEPFMASSIFRRAFDDGSSQREIASRPAGLSTQARKLSIGYAGRETDD